MVRALYEEHHIGYGIDPEYYQVTMRRFRESEAGKWF